MVLSSDSITGRQINSSLETVKRSPPQELKLHQPTVQPLQIEIKKINLPTITVIESSPVHEYSPQQSFATKLAHTAVHSIPNHALSESHPLPISSNDTVLTSNRETPTIEALIKATKATFAKEHLPMQEVRSPISEGSLISNVKEEGRDNIDNRLVDSNDNGPGKPKPSDLPPLKTLTITCPSSPLLQRHALYQAQKEAESSGVKVSSPPILRRNTAKRSPPLFRTSLTETENKSKTIDGSTGSLSPKLSRRYSGQGNSLLEMQAKSQSLDSKDGSMSPVFPSETSSLKSESIHESENNEMEVDEKSMSSYNSDLDMTVRSGMIDAMNIKKPEVKKNVTFSLEIDEKLPQPDNPQKVDIDMSVQSADTSIKTKSSTSKTSGKPVKEGKKKGPLGIVMGKAAIAARAVSAGAHRTVSTPSLPSNRKQPLSVTKSDTTPRKHSHSQCVMGTSAAHTSRVGHVSCATCGRRRAASQSNISSEPPTKQQAKGKQAPVRKTSVESSQRKSSEAGQSSKNSSPREESNKYTKNSSSLKKERKPFFV